MRGNEPSPLGTVESYNPVKRRWEYVAPMPTARCSSALMQTTSMLFVIGGVAQGPNKIKIDLDGFKCAGAVRYSTDGKTPSGYFCNDEWEHKVVFLDDPHSSCSGKVGIENGDNISWLSGSNVTWNNKSADTVCRQIHCGTAQSFNYIRNDDKRNAISKKSYSCSSNNTSLFDCETNTLPSDHNDTIATVICSGEIKINLTKTCWGKVNICMDGNCGGVCAATWGKTMSEKLCEQLDCGTVSDSDVLSKRDNTVIVKSSITPKLQISRDKCSGNLEMMYEGELLPVCKDALKDKNTQNIICEELGCGPALNAIDYFGPESNKTRYEIKQPPTEDNKIPIVPIILGVGFLLVLVILIVVFVRICIVRKAKNVSSRIFSRKEVEFESGDVEDFNSKANEMEDFGHGRGFRSEAEFIEEHDARSTSSFSYDDIDEVDEARPLTSQADSAGTSGENYIPENGVTYEVDDPQENYDDIEASPEIKQTQAEVHDGPKTTPEREAVIAGLVPEDEDYLVPGQDGPKGQVKDDPGKCNVLNMMQSMRGTSMFGPWAKSGLSCPRANMSPPESTCGTLFPNKSRTSISGQQKTCFTPTLLHDVN
eukprot:superscaffoldBa00000166_g2355